MWKLLSLLTIVGSSLCLHPSSVRADQDSFYAQRDEVRGVVVKAPRSVDARALAVTVRIASVMLTRQDIAYMMKKYKVELAIVPRNAYITALPEYAGFKGQNDPHGKPYHSYKVRGAGATPQRPVAVTAEENLLGIEGDPHAAENVTCHSLAHSIFTIGFSEGDRSRWQKLYVQAKQRNAFPDAAAMSSAEEYWAELSQSFFGVNSQINGPDTIRRHDPEAFYFLEDIYRRR